MTFDTLVKRALMESQGGNDIRTLESGAKFWGGMAIAPQTPTEITIEQSKDYGIPPSLYKRVGEGSGSVVYSDGETVVKLSKARLGGTFVNRAIQETQWTDMLESRMREHERLKKIEDIPPYLIPQEGTFLHYSTYKNFDKKPVEGAVYSKDHKGFGIFDEYKFSTAGSHMLDNGIIEQQVVDTERFKIKDRNLLFGIGDHIKKYIGSLDNRGISSNIFFNPDNRIIYVIDN